jgi:predicted  nucleic acid-binding Zn-ribbon protein
MTTADTEARTALQELLDERQRYQGWLRALEQRRAATPAHVYERVHTDYTLRLERVMQRLSERAEQLSATIEGMQSRLQTLRSREADRTDERNEYELRAAVGELTPEEWERRRAEADRELGAISEDRRQIEGELAELQRVVAMTREQPPEPVPTPEPEAEQASAASEGAAQSPRVQSAPPQATSEATAQGRGAGAHEGPPSTAGEHPLAASPAGESPSIDDFVAEWPLRQMGGEGGVNGASEAPSTAPATATWHPPVPDRGERAAARSAEPAVPASPAGSTFAPPENAHDIHEHHVGEARRDMDKTLKCPECGAMNYATEWYCERCGGELASF